MDAAGWRDPWKGEEAETARATFNVDLSNKSAHDGEPVRIHMTRDPKEDVAKSPKRLQLTMQ